MHHFQWSWGFCVQYSRSFWYGEKCIARSVKYVLIYKLSFFCFLYFWSAISLIADDLYVYSFKELAVNYIKKRFLLAHIYCHTSAFFSTSRHNKHVDLKKICTLLSTTLSICRQTFKVLKKSKETRWTAISVWLLFF